MKAAQRAGLRYIKVSEACGTCNQVICTCRAYLYHTHQHMKAAQRAGLRYIKVSEAYDTCNQVIMGTQKVYPLIKAHIGKTESMPFNYIQIIRKKLVFKNWD